MICVKKKNTNEVKDILHNKTWGGGHYCHNIELLEEVKDGPYKIRNILKNRGKMAFYVVYDESEPLIIAPIFAKNKIVTVAGTDEFFDYVDLFYRMDVEKGCLKDAFASLMGFFRSHGNSVVRWNYIPEESISREFLLESKCKFKPIDNTEISFLKYEDYLSMLSKSTKQNLRTAENRLKRENKTFKLLSSLCEPIPDEILQQCIDIYCERQREKYGKGLFNRLMIKTFNYSTEMLRKRKGIIIALIIDENVAAFMFGYINDVRKSYEVPKLAISEKYAFYSPGMILVNRSIQLFADMTDIRVLDLCRGTEQYKIKMGGKNYHTYNCIIEL